MLPREPTSDYDRAALVDDLKLAGFEDCMAENLGARVDAVKDSGWTYDMGRQEAIRQAQQLLKNSHVALDAFRTMALPPTGTQKKRSLAEEVADSSNT